MIAILNPRSTIISLDLITINAAKGVEAIVRYGHLFRSDDHSRVMDGIAQERSRSWTVVTSAARGKSARRASFQASGCLTQVRVIAFGYIGEPCSRKLKHILVLLRDQTKAGITHEQERYMAHMWHMTNCPTKNKILALL